MNHWGMKLTLRRNQRKGEENEGIRKIKFRKA